jgi:penicillin-insensitive murein endopeptidase
MLGPARVVGSLVIGALWLALGSLLLGTAGADEPTRTTSVGAPTGGRLEGGVAFPERGPGYERDPGRPNTDGFWGTEELVLAVTRAAAEVARELPGGTLRISDASLPAGGRMSHHHSHRAGRDVDLPFHLIDLQGRPVPSREVVIEPDGTGVDFGDLLDPADDVPVRLDVARTWGLVRALVGDEGAAVQRFFVAEHVRTLLLAEAARTGTHAATIERAGDVMCEPRSTPHDDHLHLRLFCSAEDLARGCVDATPLYPWRRRALAALGVVSRPAPTPRPEADPPHVPPPAHPRVLAMRTRRALRTAAPRPGRRWCR